MSKKKLIIIGTSLYSDIAEHYFNNYTNYEIIGFAESIDVFNKKKTTKIFIFWKN